MKNQIRKVISARIENLTRISDAIGGISHSTTKGDVRENLLIDFFCELIPSQLSIKKGIICDSSGNSTKQTDFIVYDPAMLPTITLSGNIGLIPVEAACLQAEIKSLVSTKTVEQVDSQIEALRKLDPFFSGGNLNDFMVPTVVFGYSCDVAKSTLIDWLKRHCEKKSNLVAVCIINAYSLLLVGPGKVKCVDSDDSDSPTMSFIWMLYEALKDVTEKRGNLRPDWKQYLGDNIQL